MIRGSLRRSAESVWVEADSGIRLPAPRQAAGQDGLPVSYGVRPENITVQGRGSLDARVTLVEMMGSHYQVLADVNGHQVCLTMDRSRPVAPGDRISLSFNSDSVHLFDQGTGERIQA
jgi:multiple sugar transport system ATP-binding protein